MPELNFWGTTVPVKARSFHSDFPVNLIKINSSDDKIIHSMQEICFFFNTYT